MSSVSSISSSLASTYSDISAIQRRHRPDTSEMAADLFSKLDTSGKGYIEQSDLATALSGLSSASSSQSAGSSASASDIFSQLDSNGDGKVTEAELSTSLKKLADELDSQFNQSRMESAMQPPPPAGAQGTGASDTGFTQDELKSQLSEIGSSDSKRSTLISNIINNFDKADTNSDGKVSFQEAMVYDQANSSSASASTTSSSTEKTDAQVFRQLMELLRAYGNGNEGASSLSTLSSLISTSA